jgi:protein gp37
MAARLEAMGVEKYRGLTRKSGGRAKWTGAIHLDEGALRVPISWSRPRNVFVNSMSDLFHPDVPVSFIRKVWSVMSETPRHTYQILTKRPDRMAEILQHDFPVLPNVWLGTSVEDGRVIHRLDELRLVPAALRFVSFEPLIGSVSAGHLTDIQWAIVGGESGPSARQMDFAWIDEIFDMCADAGTAFFFKQWGGQNKKKTGRSYRGRTWDNMPTIAA